MYLDDPPEKDIEELYARTEEPDESERASHSHELGMYVSYPLILICEPPDQISCFSGTRSTVEAMAISLRAWCEPARRKPPACDSFSPRRDLWAAAVRETLSPRLDGIFMTNLGGIQGGYVSANAMPFFQIFVRTGSINGSRKKSFHQLLYEQIFSVYLSVCPRVGLSTSGLLCM